MTGGAFGSMIAQLFSLTSAERKTLLVAGAAAGMSATFATPLAAILLAVELLLFEWKPRSFVPVALASATAAIARPFILGAGPLFPVAPHASVVGARRCSLCCVVAGIGAGMSVGDADVAVYAAEDLFEQLPIHWMWWPMFGGLVIGIGGLIAPRALGVGYDVIGDLLARATCCRRRSSRSSIVKAPDLVDLARLRHVRRRARAAAHHGRGARRARGARVPRWRARVLAARRHGRDPRRHDALAAHRHRVRRRAHARHEHVLAAHDRGRRSRTRSPCSSLKRSILTEKLARRGFHVSREYAIDELEILFARDAMNTDIVILPRPRPSAI